MTRGLAGRVFREKRGIILALLVLAVANAAVLGGVVYPLQQRVASADQRAANAGAELAAAERQEKLARGTVAGKERAERELRRFYGEILPTDQSAARRITYLRLADLAREANLRFEHRTFSVEEQRDSSLRRLDIMMILRGGYNDIRQFIHELERSEEFVVITGVELSQREQTDAPIEVTMQLATFYRTDGNGR